jgi:hypothetical protein
MDSADSSLIGPDETAYRLELTPGELKDRIIQLG